MNNSNFYRRRQIHIVRFISGTPVQPMLTGRIISSPRREWAGMGYRAVTTIPHSVVALFYLNEGNPNLQTSYVCLINILYIQQENRIRWSFTHRRAPFIPVKLALHRAG